MRYVERDRLSKRLRVMEMTCTLMAAAILGCNCWWMTTGSMQTGKISLLLSILLISLSTTSTIGTRERRQFICWVEFEILFHQDRNDSLHSSRILAPVCADGSGIKQPAVGVKIKASNVIFSHHLLLAFLLCFLFFLFLHHMCFKYWSN